MRRRADFEIGDLFSPLRGKGKYTRWYCRTNAGEYPVYSASLSQPLGYMNSADYSGPHLTVTLNGYAGSTQVVDGDFSVNGDRSVLVPLNSTPKIDLDFLSHSIEPTLRSLAIGRIVDGKANEFTKISPEVISSATVTLPVTERGEIDVSETVRIGAQIRYRNSLRENLSARLQSIEQCEFLIESEIPMETIALEDTRYFRMTIGRRILLRDLVDYGIPVYSANVRVPFGFLNAVPSGLSFDYPSLVWAIDGVFDWNLFNPGYEFIPTDHLGRLEVINPLLYPRYLLWELTLTAADHGFDRVYRSSLQNMRSIGVRIPMNRDGSPDIAAQIELADRYDSLHKSREMCIAALRDVVSVNVEAI